MFVWLKQEKVILWSRQEASSDDDNPIQYVKTVTTNMFPTSCHQKLSSIIHTADKLVLISPDYII